MRFEDHTGWRRGVSALGVRKSMFDWTKLLKKLPASDQKGESVKVESEEGKKLTFGSLHQHKKGEGYDAVGRFVKVGGGGSKNDE